MAIVTMKRLRLFAMSSDRDPLFRQLQHFGCVEVSEQTARLDDPEWAALVTPEEGDLSVKQADLTAVSSALDTLDRYVPAKASFLSPRPEIAESELFRDDAMRSALDMAQTICSHAAAVRTAQAQLAKLAASRASLAPWEPLEVPLECSGTDETVFYFATCPATSDLDAIQGALSAAAEATALLHSSTDRELHYFLVICHRSQKEEALTTLKAFGVSQASFRGLTGTAKENIAKIDAEVAATEAALAQDQAKIAEAADMRMNLKVCYDRLTQDLQREQNKERLLRTERTILLEGWLPESEVPALEKLLGNYTCAYELTDPEPEEYPQVPVKLRNNVFSRCMNVVTEMYALPAYDGIDPNPLMAPFFIVFFGIMMADMGYGILMIAAALFVLKRTRPRESTRNFMELVLWCGVTTLIVGAMTGGFLGDFIPQILKLINPDSTFEMPALFTPLDDTVAIMLGSLALGVIQIFTGMTVSVVKKIKDGQFIDALFDEFTWWIIIAGAVLAIFGIGNVAGVPVVLVIGILMLVFGGTRNSKGFGKLTCLVGLVYNGVTGYFSDTLSYIRLMALMLSGSVIGQVFNTLAAAFGNIFLFIIISLIGNALNLALNLLGCYVHDLRLQCLEFFNRFYKEGGKPYQPLSIQTKYVDIVKEEQ